MKRLFVGVLALVMAAALLPAAALAETAAEETPIVDPYRIYTYEQLTEDLAALEARYPALVSVSSIGQSVEGREIPLLYLGKGERNILICAAMHAREFETTNAVMYMAEQYCRAYEANEWYYGLSYRELLDGVRFVIVPVLNPDGVVIAQQGTPYALENPALAAMPITDGWPGNYACWKANANGVDLNRNWPYLFNNTYRASSPCSADYAGPEPLSEPETRAMYELIERTPFESFCSFHSAGDCVYWIDSSNSPALREKLYPTASRIASFCGYLLMMDEDVSRGGGYMINHVRAATEKPCITVEIGPYVGNYPYSNYDKFGAVIEKAYPVALLLADEALHPAAEAPAQIAEAPAPAIEAPTPAAEAPAPAAEATDPEVEAPAPATEAQAQPDAQEAAVRDIRVVVDGEEVNFPDIGPVIENDRVLTPMRAACEAAGLQVNWTNGSVMITDGDHWVSLAIDWPYAVVDNRTKPLDCAPVLRDGRTLLPIRAVMEPFGFSVAWDGESRSVLISRNAA